MIKVQSKDLLSIKDLSSEEIYILFNLAKTLKNKNKKNNLVKILKNKTLGMIFTKSSTRTRVSFETGIFKLGGQALYLNANDIQIGRGETIEDTARVLSRYLDGIMIRTYAHKDVETLAQYASIPVINGLTDFLHPCQILADLFTYTEKKKLTTNTHFIYMGDGNNVANSWLVAATVLNFKMTFIVPEEYTLKKEIFDYVGLSSDNLPSNINIVHSIEKDIIASADVLYTDVWVSMGQAAEREERLKILAPYQLNSKVLSMAKSDVMVMHCLPAHRGEEITHDVIESKNSVVFDEAENRMHIQNAIMATLMS